jgi:hypothetical protein
MVCPSRVLLGETERDGARATESADDGCRSDARAHILHDLFLHIVVELANVLAPRLADRASNDGPRDFGELQGADVGCQSKVQDSRSSQLAVARAAHVFHARFDHGAQKVELEELSTTPDLHSRRKVKVAVGKFELAAIDVAENEMERSGSEWWRRERQEPIVAIGVRGQH